MASKLAQMQARFQHKQMQEKEEKLLKLYENQQQRTIERVSRDSAGSDGTTTSTIPSIHAGKVRQMFDERRQKAGIDRSYPLEPLKSKNNTLKPTIDRNRKTLQKNQKTVKNGKPATKKREVAENGNEENHRRIQESDPNDNDLIDLMNNHNLNENIDDEEMPNALEEVDGPGFTGKLANVGGMLPSQSEFNRKVVPTTRANGKIGIGQSQQKKPIVQKTVPKLSPKGTPSVGSRSSTQSDTTPKSSPSSPSNTNMSARKPLSTTATGTPTRVPSTNKPSARQTPRGPPSAVTRDDLATCKFCNRRFAPDRLQIHEDICARTVKKKRKAYDAMRHRVQGTELEPFTRKGPRASSRPSRIISVRKTNWRQTHDEFISTIRAAKTAQSYIAKGGKLSDLPPPPPSSNPDYVQCPHCGRRFNETAAARHIPKCATYEFNKPKGAPPGQKGSARPSAPSSGRLSGLSSGRPSARPSNR